MRAGRWRWIAFVCCICSICCLSVYMIYRENVYGCMGAAILTEKERGRFTEFEYYDFSPHLYFRGEKAAVDIGTSTIYISQYLDSTTSIQDLQGKLRLDLPQYKLYFEQTPDFDALSEMMSSGRTLKLLISDGSSKYMKYDVVLTSLPVAKMDCQVTFINDEGKEGGDGFFYVWTANDPDTNSYTVKKSAVQWHNRGATSSKFDKKPIKLSLKGSHGKNRNMSFLGLGSDDDWILSSMPLDDTKMKEKLMMDCWNKIAESDGSNIKMSRGEYTELIVNGQYVGIYLLQRRIDEKYLSLNESSILLKGRSSWQPNSPVEAYEIVYSPFGEDDTYFMAGEFFYGEAFEKINIENYVYLNLALLFGSAADNLGNKNMYYAFIHTTGDSYTVFYIPWDTDMSFGVTWENGFAYDYEKSMKSFGYRSEYSAVLEVRPELEKCLRESWCNLRADVLSDANLSSYLDVLSNQLISSGAYERDVAKWGTYYGGNDTIENLRKFVFERASLLDEKFAS